MWLVLSYMGQCVHVMHLTLQAISLKLRNSLGMFLTGELGKSVVMSHFIILSFHHVDFRVFLIRKNS